jgi:hyperosmotically inducible protein
MRFVLPLIALILMSGCTALVVGGSSAGGYETTVTASDSAISSRISGRYDADAVVGKYDISVRTYKGTVTLAGTVGNVAARDQAGTIAKETDGVVIVNNQIVVKD